MGVEYKAVQWNRQKRLYDFTLAGGVAAFLAVFIVVTKLRSPLITDEILLIRAFAVAAFVLLHVILCIGPLCRLNSRFLPLLYNRRHLGVTMFLLGLSHGVFSIVQFHGFGDIHPLVSLFVSNSRYGSLADFPFQPLGFFALLSCWSVIVTLRFWSLPSALTR